MLRDRLAYAVEFEVLCRLDVVKEAALSLGLEVDDQIDEVDRCESVEEIGDLGIGRLIGAEIKDVFVLFVDELDIGVLRRALENGLIDRLTRGQE